MSGTNSFLVLGALVLLSLLSLSANRAMISSYANLLETQAMIATIAEAENLIQEISSKSFDQAIAVEQSSAGKSSGGASSSGGGPPEDKGQSQGGGPSEGEGPPFIPPGWLKRKKPADFTPPGLLGKEQGEEYPFFNDVDDYHGLQKKHDHPVFGSIELSVTVQYVDPNNTATISSDKQSLVKKVEVKAFNKGLEDTLKLYHAIYQ